MRWGVSHKLIDGRISELLATIKPYAATPKAAEHTDLAAIIQRDI
jgi:hypothetical protein